jgi:hypothetical protein
MGNIIPKKINFEDIQLICKKQRPFSIIINTLDSNEQKCLIQGTILADKEENTINELIQNKSFHITIVIYGRNFQDEEKIIKKYKQLQKLGFKNIYIYCGGLFEWLLLQDIYGVDEFPTTFKENDILKYKSNSLLSIQMIDY